MKQINLLEIWEEVLTRPDGPYESKDFDILYPYKELIVAAMKEAVREALELAAENAEIKLICSNPDCRNESYNSLHEYSCCDKCYSIMEESVDKESITGIINQVI